jgi:hypothetical protein
MPVTPGEYAAEIAAQTEVLREFAEFSVAAAAAEKSKSKADVEALPKVRKPTRWMTNLEYVRYLARLEALKKGWSAPVVPHPTA